jgi:hypothetical protein
MNLLARPTKHNLVEFSQVVECKADMNESLGRLQRLEWLRP